MSNCKYWLSIGDNLVNLHKVTHVESKGDNRVTVFLDNGTFITNTYQTSLERDNAYKTIKEELSKVSENDIPAFRAGARSFSGDPILTKDNMPPQDHDYARFPNHTHVFSGAPPIINKDLNSDGSS